MPEIIVTDGEQRPALAVVRSLGRAGHRVTVLSSSPRALAFASRHAARTAVVPDPNRDATSFVAAVRDGVRDTGARLVVPVTEASLLALLAERSALAPALLPLPDQVTVRRVLDKAAVLQAAADLGIAVPHQAVYAAPGAAPAPAGADLRFPVAIKPSRSLNPHRGGLGKWPTSYADDDAELGRRLATYPAEAYPLLVQQRVRGPGEGVFLLVWSGETIATFAHRRVREKPPAGGVSVCCESVAPDAALLEQSRALLGALGWEGVAMVEYKRDAATGVPYLMEVNGRFWGSLQLALDAGVDFPALLVAAAIGERPAPVTAWRVGIRSRWWWGDVDHLLARLLKSRASLGLPADAPGRWRVLRDVLVPRPGQRGEVLRVSDPLPFVRETVNWLSRR